MTQQLTVLLLEQKSDPKQIGALTGERVVIGRECPEGITVEVAGVSRNHGEFVRVRSQYVFSDLGSTNGSWVNGKRVDALRPVVLRSGDTLQLAAAALKIGSGGGIKSEVPSLLVTRLIESSGADAEVGALVSVEEFPIPAAGVVMTLGGIQSDIEDCAEEAAARVLKEDGGLTLEILSEEALLNGLHPAAVRVPIGDNDVIGVRAVRVVVNIPPRLSTGAPMRSAGVFGSNVSSNVGISARGGIGVGAQEKREVEQTTIFAPGSLDEHINPDATTAIFDSDALRESQRETAQFSTGQLKGRYNSEESQRQVATSDMHPSNRFGETSQPLTNSLGLSPLEIKLVIVMAIMLFSSVFLLGLWWFSQNR